MAIKFFKNNSKLISFVLKKADGTAWNIPDGDVCKFTVKKSVADADASIVISKSFEGDGGNSYSIFLNGSDTSIPCGSYVWDIKDTTLNLTLMAPDSFLVEEVALVGDAATGAENEDEDIVVTVSDGVVSLDYNNLSNLPKINSVELTGNKSLAALGVQASLVAGDNITITDNVISASGGQYYYASDGLDLVDDDTFKVNIKDSEDVLGIDQGQLVINQSNINTSEINNDAGYITNSYHDSTKQDTLTAGTGISIVNNVISVNLTNADTEDF